MTLYPNPDAEALIARWGGTVCKALCCPSGACGNAESKYGVCQAHTFADDASAAIRALLPAIEQARRDALEEAATVAMAYRDWVNWTGDMFPDEPGTSILTLSPLPDTKGGE